MKKLFLVVMLLCVSCAYAADFPSNTNAVLDYLYAKLGSKVSRTSISTDNIDAKMCMLQYQSCKDERAILRVLTRHIDVADKLMDSKVNGDGQRGLLIAYSAFKCVNVYLKDDTLAAGIAIGMIQPNINFASDDFTRESGKRFVANEILNAAQEVDNDNAIINAFNLIIGITQQSPNTVDAYRIKYAFYQYNHSRYVESLAQLDAMTDPNMISGSIKLRAILMDKLNKVVN